MLKQIIVIFLIVIINIFLIDNLVTNELFYQTYSQQFPVEIVTKILMIKQKFKWLNYALPPIILLIKFFFVTSCFWIGYLFIGENRNFKKFLEIVIISEFVFIVYSFIKTGLLYYNNFQTLTEINQFQPLSLFSMLNTKNIPAYLHYPLALISIPEVFYWIVLSILLKSLVTGNFWSRIGFVAKTYGIGLLIWVSIVVFVTLNFTA